MARQLFSSAAVSGTVDTTAVSEVHAVLFLLLVIVVCLGYLYKDSPTFKKFEVFFPHASANMVFGIIVGAIMSVTVDNASQYGFDPTFFFSYLLPPIIFSAGFAVRKDFFFHNFGSIMAFAFLGTLITSFFIGGCLYSMNVTSPKMTFIDSMILGSLISAVDPVAVILAVQELKVDAQLKVMLFGEAVLNDAAAVVINRVFVAVKIHERSSSDALGWAVPEIIGITIGSILVGTVFALLASYIHKHTHLEKYPAWELAAFMLAAYTPFAVAEAAHLSGITAVLFAGIMSDYYTFYHLSVAGQNASKVSVRTFALLAEAFVFVYLGMSFFLSAGLNWDFKLAFAVLFLCLVGRMLSVFPLGFCLNLKRRHSIPLKHQVILWFSGLRGPVAYALALAVPHGVDKHGVEIFPLYGEFLSTTLFVVAFTTFILGALAYPLIKYLEPGEMASTNTDFDYTHHWFNRMDQTYLRPFFGPAHRTQRQDPMASNVNLDDARGDHAQLTGQSQNSVPAYDHSAAVNRADHDVVVDVQADQEESNQKERSASENSRTGPLDDVLASSVTTSQRLSVPDLR